MSGHVSASAIPVDLMADKLCHILLNVGFFLIDICDNCYVGYFAAIETVLLDIRIFLQSSDSERRPTTSYGQQLTAHMISFIASN